ncbi:ARM repeat-containing protein [Aulographum hederae CBS 113979]|uniref:ARM repeat-containing protein n=1 Tax=Aulographum hederae CBS 113979 TaxID=1176131 RepID=A0A6G1GTF8_9PEZI|nr:ARM repeat-containing protein [Aulographum hederae CBS 113979]
MAEEEDFSSLPLPERFVHKNWKVRKEGYEAAAKAFDTAPSESDPTVREFIQDAGIWKAAVGDSNVAAQQEALGALCSFLQIAGTAGCTRTRNSTIVPIVEKGLAATRPAAKEKALEALMLYIEMDKADPIIEELLPILSHKQPKIIAATLTALTSIYKAYGCKTVEPKPALKLLPKVYGHADKKVREEAQKLTVELYRWLKDAMKPFFWNDLKPVQQQDLEKLFEPVKNEPPPKPTRLLRSQQAIHEAAPAESGAEVVDEDEEDVGIDLEPEYLAVDVMPKIPKEFHDRLGSTKWKDRKEALDELFTAINHPKIEENQFSDIMSGLAKCMKDANIAVVSVAANCIECFANGLKRSFAKYRSVVMSPMMERLKEKKQAVTDAIGAALDAVFAATSLSECLEETLGFLAHKNPQVKLESTRFLMRCLRTTREAPQAPEVKSIADAATKLLTESQESQRSAGAEVLGTLWKIMGDRMMASHLEGLDEIRKTKIKEFHDSAKVIAKYKPKAAPPPKAAAPPPQKKVFGQKAKAAGVRKAASAVAAPPPVEEPAATPLAPRPTSRPAAGASKLGRPKYGLVPPSGLKRPGMPSAASSGISSPRRQAASPTFDEPEPTPAAPKIGGLAGRGLAGRPLGKPAVANEAPLVAPSGLAGLNSAERVELEELREENERLKRQNEDMRAERSRLSSQVHELQDQNAQLIEDHTRDVLSIKAKETQLVRARSDAETAEQTVQSQQREIDRLKRELSRQKRAVSPPSREMNGSGSDIYSDGGSSNTALNGSRPQLYGGRSYVTSPTGEGSTSSMLRRADSGSRSPARWSASSGLGAQGQDGDSRLGTSGGFGASGAAAGNGESWKRAAEVTQNLKARIEQMKARQGLSRPQ